MKVLLKEFSAELVEVLELLNSQSLHLLDEQLVVLLFDLFGLLFDFHLLLVVHPEKHLTQVGIFLCYF